LKTLLQFAAVLTLLAVGAGTAVVVYDLHGLIADARGEWREQKTRVEAVIGSAQEAARTAALFAAEQRAQIRKTGADSDKTVHATRLVIDEAGQFFRHADQQINNSLLPDFDREVVATSHAAQFSFLSVTHAGDALTLQLNDPAIAETLDAFNQAARNLSAATASGADVLAHADHTAAYYDKKLTTPLGFWKMFLKTLVPIAGASGSVAAGFAK
jgi:hypothetical protein